MSLGVMAEKCALCSAMRKEDVGVLSSLHELAGVCAFEHVEKAYVTQSGALSRHLDKPFLPPLPLPATQALTGGFVCEV